MAQHMALALRRKGPVAAVRIGAEVRFALGQGAKGAGHHGHGRGFIDIADHADFDRSIAQPVGNRAAQLFEVELAVILYLAQAETRVPVGQDRAHVCRQGRAGRRAQAGEQVVDRLQEQDFAFLAIAGIDHLRGGQLQLQFQVARSGSGEQDEGFVG